jgi:chromosome segregation protein
LLERIQPRPGHEEIAHALLGDVYLVDSLREAFDVYGQGRLPATFVTRSGDIATPDGIVRGGSDGGASGSFTRVREVNDLEAEVRSLEAQVRASESAHTSAESNLEATAQELDNIRNRHHTAALAMANHEKDLERTAERVKALGEAQQSRGAERADLLAELEALTEEQTRLEQQLGTARDDRTQRQTALDALGLKLGSTGRELSRLESRVTELRVAHNARLENRDRLSETVERAANSCRETAEWIERREREIETGAERKGELEAQQVQLNETLAIQLEAEEVARQRSDDLRDAYETKAAELRAIDDTVRELRGELTGSQEHAASAELALRESEMRLQHQAENIRERWSIDITSWVLPEIPEKPATETAKPGSSESADSDASDERASAGQFAEAEVAARLQGVVAADDSEGGETDGPQTASEAQSLYREARRNAELARAPREERESTLEGLRKSLQALGDVNLGAIEEHEELAERYRFLSEQRGDLLETIETLREAIARINRTSRKRFRETFEAVSKRFSENFPRLFGGGKASLQLTEAEDVLDAGIDIMAMPPGKRLQNVNLLSGGEKTMTALALLVAVFQVRPSPFFLLDEVDAALDDANVGRFNQLITEMARDSQFLVITHNKRTIEVADVLYGVTMEQKGVSKLVGVELTG